MTATSLRVVTTAGAAQGAIMDRHAELQRALDEWAGTLIWAVDHATPTARAVRLLRAFLTREVLPHIQAEERSLYPAAAHHARTELLVRSLVSENRSIAWHASRLAAETGSAAAATAEAIRSLFAVHVAKENYLLLPAVARSRNGLTVLVSRDLVRSAS